MANINFQKYWLKYRLKYFFYINLNTQKHGADLNIIDNSAVSVISRTTMVFKKKKLHIFFQVIKITQKTYSVACTSALCSEFYMERKDSVMSVYRTQNENWIFYQRIFFRLIACHYSQMDKGYALKKSKYTIHFHIIEIQCSVHIVVPYFCWIDFSKVARVQIVG